MNIFGVDYSAGFSSATPSAVKRAGARFVCRYLSTPGNPKNLTRGEARLHQAAGLQIVTVFETTAGRALRGRAAGIVDARAAIAQLAAVGGPKGAPLYFAVDFDAADHAPHLPDGPAHARAKLGPVG